MINGYWVVRFSDRLGTRYVVTKTFMSLGPRNWSPAQWDKWDFEKADAIRLLGASVYEGKWETVARVPARSRRI